MNERVRRDLGIALQLLMVGELDRAGKLLEQLAAEAPHSAAVLNALGAVRYDSGDHAGAREVLERCVAVEPDHPLANATLGELALRRGDAAAAAAHFGYTLRSSQPGMENVQRWVKALWSALSQRASASAPATPQP